MSAAPAKVGPRVLDLGCDWGESLGAWSLGAPVEILDAVSSVHLACGFHAGDPLTIQRSIAAALDRDVAVGAHPGWPDLVGFGRRELGCSPAETTAIVLYQIGALAAMTAAAGGRLTHVKPHGALYNQAARDPKVAAAVAQAIAAIDPRLVVFTLPDSALAVAAAERGLRVAREFFADRRYQADGSLAPRSLPEATIDDPADAATQLAAALDHGEITTIDGQTLAVTFDAVGVHGDGPRALEIARVARQVIEARHYGLAPVENHNGRS